MTPVPGGLVVAWLYAACSLMRQRPGRRPACQDCADDLERELGPALKALVERSRKVER